MIALLALAVFASAAALDYCAARYNREISRPEPSPHGAARWSIAMYVVGAVGLLAVVRVDLWLMIPEAAGLYAGTWFAASRVRPRPA